MDFVMFSYNRFNFFPCLEGYISIVNFIVTVKNICIITMKIKLHFYSQPNYLFRTAIEAEILFAVCLSKCGFWSVSVKTPPEKAHAAKRLERKARCCILFSS